MIYGGVSIKGMKYFVFNKEIGKYECAAELGKTAQEIAKEYGDVTNARTRQYAAERKLPYIGTEASVSFYIFDAAAEEAFKNRPRESPGRSAIAKPPKIPGKPGRPRIHPEKPEYTGPKRSVGRPRKEPKEGLNIVPKAKHGRPRK